MQSVEELRLEFCRIYAQSGLDAQDAIHRAEKLVQYITKGPKPPEKESLKRAA